MNVYKKMIAQWATVARPVTMPKYQTLSSESMVIRNSCFENRIFRKVHVEYAVAGPVEIIHQVAYPWASVDLPIFGADIMYVHGDATMGIVDLSLDTKDPIWTDVMQTTVPLGGTPRDMPDWGWIFSDDVVFLQQPDTTVFEAYALKVQRQYAQLSIMAGYGMHEDFHRMYCTQQLKNTKTRQMLSKAFGASVASEYMEDIMFDVLV